MAWRDAQRDVPRIPSGIPLVLPLDPILDTAFLGSPADIPFEHPLDLPFDVPLRTVRTDLGVLARYGRCQRPTRDVNVVWTARLLRVSAPLVCVRRSRRHSVLSRRSVAGSHRPPTSPGWVASGLVAKAITALDLGPVCPAGGA